MALGFTLLWFKFKPVKMKCESFKLKKNKINIILKVAFGIFATLVISAIAVICFYIWMIYGIHPSDEGSRSLACEYDQNYQVTKAEETVIQDGKMVVSKADPSLCVYDPEKFK